jgi:hypothetical protein
VVGPHEHKNVVVAAVACREGHFGYAGGRAPGL